MLKIVSQGLCISALLLSAGCSPQAQDGSNDTDVTLRNLTDASVAAPLQDSYPIEGDLIPTPSDTRTRYFLVRHRKPLTSDNLIALLREERGDKAAYARVELNCAKRLFHIVGVANRRSFAETSANGDGPLRPIDGYPLREDIAKFVCERHGERLAAG